MSHPLDVLLNPATIALVGASNRKDSPGSVLANLILKSSFQGTVWPVNPGYEFVCGETCYPSFSDLPGVAEHVVLAIGNERLEQALADAIKHGAKSATIFSSCVLEDDSSPPLKDRLQKMAREAGLALCGGNGMGFYNISQQLYVGVFPVPAFLEQGSISFIAQSGSAFTALAHNGIRLKFNLCVSSGNELATTVADYMDWSLAQHQTRVIGLFLEAVRDPEGFVKVLEKAQDKKIPVVVLKVGKSPLGAKMTQSHTGAVAGSHAAYEAVFKKYGVIEVQDFLELIATLQVFQSCEQLGEGELATIQESGGLMEFATDIAHELEIPFARISSSTKVEIARHLDPGLKPDNPLDAWGSNENFENRFYACLSALMADSKVAVGMFVSNFRDGYYLSEAFLRVVKKVSMETNKPVIMTNCLTDLQHKEFCLRTAEANIPFIDGARQALLAVRHLFSFRDRQCSQEHNIHMHDVSIVNKWRQLLKQNTDNTLGEQSSMELLADFGISVATVKLVTNKDQLMAAAEATGFPLVLKTAHPGINHKSDVGGVVVGIEDQNQLLSEYQKMSSIIGESAIICEMIQPGTEVGLGMINDPQFGPVIMLAAGGIFIEIINERSVGLAPLCLSEIDEMLSQLKIDHLIQGARNRVACDRQSLIELIAAFSNMCYELREDIQEIDINPVIVNEKTSTAVDGLVVLTRKVKAT